MYLVMKVHVFVVIFITMENKAEIVNEVDC